MLNKILSLSLVLIMTITLSGCQEDIILDLDFTDITIIEGENADITYFVSDSEGVTFESADESIVTVDESGNIIAVSEGTVIIKVSSKSDDSVVSNLTVVVRKLITLTSELESITLIEEDTHLVVINSNDGYVYDSFNKDIFVVDDNDV